MKFFYIADTDMKIIEIPDTDADMDRILFCKSRIVAWLENIKTRDIGYEMLFRTSELHNLLH